MMLAQLVVGNVPLEVFDDAEFNNVVSLFQEVTTLFASVFSRRPGSVMLAVRDQVKGQYLVQQCHHLPDSKHDLGPLLKGHE